MLRFQSTRLGQQLQPVWRQSLFAVRHETTASTVSTSDAVKEEKPTAKPALSQRLGGSGRGKLMESSEQGNDAFASFLIRAQKKQQQRSRSNNNNNKREIKPGQFDDAVEPNKASAGGKRSNNKQDKSKQQQQASGKNNNRRQGDQQRDRRSRQDAKKSTSYGSSSTSGPTRRATTFIDKDIDWASLSPVDSVIPDTAATAGDDGAVNTEQQQLLEKELDAGDYTRFLSMGESIQWPNTLDRQGLESLVGGNASYGLDAKMTFLATVAKASNVGAAAPAKK